MRRNPFVSGLLPTVSSVACSVGFWGPQDLILSTHILLMPLIVTIMLQVWHVQQQLTGRRLLPTGCTLYQSCQTAYRQLIEAPSEMTEDGALQTARDVWSCGIHEYMALQRAARNELQQHGGLTNVAGMSAPSIDSLLPYVVTSLPRNDLPLLVDALDLSGMSRPSTYQASAAMGTYVVPVPHQWRVDATKTACNRQSGCMSVTGFVWMELSQIAARQPDCRCMLPSLLKAS